MKHWSVDTTELEKDPQAFAIWKLEQRINFGIGDDKIQKEELRKYWPQLNLDPSKRRYLAFLLSL